MNPKFKDNVFRLLFGSQKKNMLELYNALNNSNYQNPDDIKITTLEDAFYVNVKNDVSFIIDSHMAYWEQQSTYNPNMPIRGVIYYGKLLSKIIATNRDQIFQSTKMSIPIPEYVVFYNGKKDCPEYEEMKLSDLYPNDISLKGKYEFTAMVYNINKRKNDDLLNKCQTLKGYMTLINSYTDFLTDGYSNDDAIDKAIDYCIQNNILREFLIEKKAEVKEMSLFEITYEEYADIVAKEKWNEGMKEGRKEGRIEGRKEGIIEGALNNLIELFNEGSISLTNASRKANLSQEEFKELASKQK